MQCAVRSAQCAVCSVWCTVHSAQCRQLPYQFFTKHTNHTRNTNYVVIYNLTHIWHNISTVICINPPIMTSIFLYLFKTEQIKQSILCKYLFNIFFRHFCTYCHHVCYVTLTVSYLALRLTAILTTLHLQDYQKTTGKKNVNQSHYRPEVPRGFQEVKVPRLRNNGPGWR